MKWFINQLDTFTGKQVFVILDTAPDKFTDQKKENFSRNSCGPYQTEWNMHLGVLSRREKFKLHGRRRQVYGGIRVRTPGCND